MTDMKNKIDSIKKEKKKKTLSADFLTNSNTFLVILCLAAVIIISIFIPEFRTFQNATNLLIQTSSTGIMAIGLTFVIITGGIDLSLPTAMALSAIFGCTVMAKTQNVFLGVIVIIGIGMLIGTINGLAVAKLKMVPLIVTLAIATVNSGISNWYTGAKSVGGLPTAFSEIFAGSIAGIPIAAIIFILIAIIMHLVLSKTIFGRHLFQTGVNEKAAQVNGVKTVRVTFLIYFISGTMAGLAGVLSSARINVAGPSMGPQSAFMNIVCAVVLGGASVMGGKGNIFGTVVGSIIMGIITNVMNLLNVDFFITYIVKGIVIIIVTYLDVIRNRISEKG